MYETVKFYQLQYLNLIGQFIPFLEFAIRW